jgi:hypothetical protein
MDVMVCLGMLPDARPVWRLPPLVKQLWCLVGFKTWVLQLSRGGFREGLLYQPCFLEMTGFMGMIPSTHLVHH